LSHASPCEGARPRHPAGGCVRARRRALARIGGCVLSLAAGFEPELALADTSAARAELLATQSQSARTEPARSEPPTAPERPPLELRVSYRAPRECPSSGDFLAALQQHVAAGGSGAIDADVSIRRASASEFELVLRQRVEGRSSESITRAASCLPLMQLAALDTSMARTASSDVGTARVAPAPPFELEPSPGPRASAPRELEAAGDGGRDGPAASSAPPGPDRRGTRVFVLGDVRTVSGMLPRLAWGRGISAGIALDVLSLRVSASFWQGQHAAFAPDGTSPMHLDFAQHSFQLSPCAGHALSSLLRVDGCALVAAHRIGTDAEGARSYASLGAAALATLSPWRGVRVELEGGLSAAIQPPSFGAEQVRYLYEPEVIQPSARVALGWEFGGGT
jgi:hypothetical protein